MVRVICWDISKLGQNDYDALYRAAGPERRRRADRYQRREDALRCVAAEALVRFILGTDRFTVETDPFGKPRIAEYPDFHYNLSHSGNWVVIAWGDGPVGVDVERHSPDTDWASIARHFFSLHEQQMLERAEDPCGRFYEIWTGKESYLKYYGTGLRYDLQSFSVDRLEEGLNIHTRQLPGGYSLSLCTKENAYSLELLDGQRLR